MIPIFKDYSKKTNAWVGYMVLFIMGLLFAHIIFSAVDAYNDRPVNPKYAYYWQAVNYIDGTSDIADPQFREHIREAAQHSYRDAQVINECFEMIESCAEKEWNSYHENKSWEFGFIPGEYKGDGATFVNDVTEYYQNGTVRDGFFREYRQTREQYYKEQYVIKKNKAKPQYSYTYKRDESGKLIYGYFPIDEVGDSWTTNNTNKSDSYNDHNYDGPFNDPSDYDDIDEYLDDAWGYDFEDWDDANEYFEDY